MAFVLVTDVNQPVFVWKRKLVVVFWYLMIFSGQLVCTVFLHHLYHLSKYDLYNVFKSTVESVNQSVRR